VYFASLSESNLPRPGADGQSYDICSWYSRWEGRLSGLNAICHSVASAKVASANGIPVVYVSPPFQRISDWRAGLQFVSWGLKAIGIATMDLMRGRWWHSVILGEAVYAKAVQLLGTREIAKQYLFHYSGTIYRPMWTYEAEKKGASIICYFYSTSEQVKLPTGYHSQRYEWGAASWPIYLVWDVFQAATIRREIDSPSEIRVVGPIEFDSAPLEIPPFKTPTIAVFDIQPPRSSRHFGISTLSDYGAEHPNAKLQFIVDIHSAIADTTFGIAFKRKRPSRPRTQKLSSLGEFSFQGGKCYRCPAGSACLSACRALCRSYFGALYIDSTLFAG
jgi:polysaccharide biosynthesis PFTS motif protein